MDIDACFSQATYLGEHYLKALGDNCTTEAVDNDTLKQIIEGILEQQGYKFENGLIALPGELSKEQLRELHSLAVRYRRERAKKGLKCREPKLIQKIASGTEVDPQRITPFLVEVQPGSEEELLFRYVSLHWSIPVSSGYGRRLRFLVFDEQNGKLIGLFGLGDPVFALGARDDWVGSDGDALKRWTKDARKARLRHVVDAFVLGAVPPYSYLLCGKLVAMLVASNEVRETFRSKYAGRQSFIQDERHDGRLALITTTSALGRSSLYNRLTFKERLLYEKTGFTLGSGEFHFTNGVYGAIMKYVRDNGGPSAKQTRWGSGFRNRREVVRKCLIGLGLSTDWLYHGVKREVFVIPLADNTRGFLRGEEDELEYYDQPVDELFEWFRCRWLLPRAERDTRYRAFDPKEYLIFG